MIAEGMSEIGGLDPDNPPAEGLSFNFESGALSYNVDGQGATIRLTPDDALMLARWLMEFAKRCDGPAAEVIDLRQWRETAD